MDVLSRKDVEQKTKSLLTLIVTRDNKINVVSLVVCIAQSDNRNTNLNSIIDRIPVRPSVNNHQDLDLDEVLKICVGQDSWRISACMNGRDGWRAMKSAFAPAGRESTRGSTFPRFGTFC